MVVAKTEVLVSIELKKFEQKSRFGSSRATMIVREIGEGICCDLSSMGNTGPLPFPTTTFCISCGVSASNAPGIKTKGIMYYSVTEVLYLCQFFEKLLGRSPGSVLPKFRSLGFDTFDGSTWGNKTLGMIDCIP
jgi:hypothetical protein